VLHSLRLPGESDDAFRARAARAAKVARVLVEACLQNRCMRQYIEDPSLPYSESNVRKNPTVRIEYEQAIAIGGIGETLAATRSKSWGDGPWLMPLEPDHVFDPFRITYIYRENSVYNRRFEQRRRLKQLLGRSFRPLVETAKRRTKSLFLEHVTADEAAAIQRILGIDPGRFWRAARAYPQRIPTRPQTATDELNPLPSPPDPRP